MLLDYQTYATLYAYSSQLVSTHSDPLPINYFWLRTKDDVASLTSVRTILRQAGVDPNSTYDRRAIVDMLNKDPLPNLIFSSLPASGILSQLGSGDFYAFQHVIPAQIVFPLLLSIIAVLLVIVWCVVLAMMAHIVARPSPGQALRLNEDEV